MHTYLPKYNYPEWLANVETKAKLTLFSELNGIGSLEWYFIYFYNSRSTRWRKSRGNHRGGQEKAETEKKTKRQNSGSSNAKYGKSRSKSFYISPAMSYRLSHGKIDFFFKPLLESAIMIFSIIKSYLYTWYQGFTVTIGSSRYAYSYFKL